MCDSSWRTVIEATLGSLIVAPTSAARSSPIGVVELDLARLDELQHDVAVITLEMLAMRNRSPGSIGSARVDRRVVDVDVDDVGRQRRGRGVDGIGCRPAAARGSRSRRCGRSCRGRPRRRRRRSHRRRSAGRDSASSNAAHASGDDAAGGSRGRRRPARTSATSVPSVGRRRPSVPSASVDVGVVGPVRRTADVVGRSAGRRSWSSAIGGGRVATGAARSDAQAPRSATAMAIAAVRRAVRITAP